MDILLILGIVFPAIGIGLLIVGVVLIFWQRRKTADWLPATGTIVDLCQDIVDPGSPGIYC